MHTVRHSSSSDYYKYHKCPKISYTKVADKMAYANNADPDQIAPTEAVKSRSTLFTVPVNILKTNYIKSKIVARKVWNKVSEILGHLPYCKE